MTRQAAITVIKVGGRVQTDPSLAPALAEAAGRGPVVVVHGGGDEVTALQRAFGIEPRFVGGRRVTADEDLDLLRMALSGVSNKRLVAALAACGVSAVGLSGEDDGLLEAEVIDSALLGRAGRPVRVNAWVVERLTSAGRVPVVSPLARDAATPGGALNVNADDAAAALAAALGAHELVLVSDVEGVLVGGAAIPALDAAAAAELIAGGVAANGMAAKLEAALAALDAGVSRVRIGDIGAVRDTGRGTTIARDRHDAPSHLTTSTR